jgi:hypothetical protein
MPHVRCKVPRVAARARTRRPRLATVRLYVAFTSPSRWRRLSHRLCRLLDSLRRYRRFANMDVGHQQRTGSWWTHGGAVVSRPLMPAARSMVTVNMSTQRRSAVTHLTIGMFGHSAAEGRLDVGV